MPCRALPEELWRQIIENLEYLELMRLKQASRQLKRLVQIDEPLIVHELFRCTPTERDQDRLSLPSSLKLHPVFAKLDFQWSTDVMKVKVPSRAGPVALMSLPVLLEEYATTPAVTHLKLIMWDQTNVPMLRYKEGVTVLHVLKSMCHAMHYIFQKHPDSYNSKGHFNPCAREWKITMPRWRGFDRASIRRSPTGPVWCLIVDYPEAYEYLLPSFYN
ncbi:hypothetical protein EDC01DRAFT_628940 [Geopyxis carbonaria]|nr:hypothetical protein EDC01DRAFT_628940 [Geopyxis carbonaria]